MATGTTNLAALPTDPNKIATTNNPTGNGMLNSVNATTTGNTAITAPVNPNPNASANAIAPPADASANSPAAGYTPALGTAGKATASTYTATPYEVAPGGLVENRIRDIVKGNSPLMQQAEQLANARSNDRGMLNSSIGTAAGQSAVLTAAAPIATADAGSINQAMTNTANAQNAAGQFNAGAENSTSQLNANLLSQMNSFNANSQNAALNLQATAKNTQIMARLDQENKLAMQTVLNDNAILLKNSDTAAQLAQQTMTNIANIQMSTTMDEVQKGKAIAAQLNIMNESLRATQKDPAVNAANTAIGSLGITDLFGLTTGGAGTGTGTGTGTGGIGTGTGGGQAITDMFGGGRATSDNLAGANLDKPPTTFAQGQSNAAALTKQAEDFETQYSDLEAKAHAIPDRKGGKAERDAIFAPVPELKRKAEAARSAAQEQTIAAYRLGTPAQYTQAVAGYQANLDKAKQEVADASKPVQLGTHLVGGLTNVHWEPTYGVDQNVLNTAKGHLTHYQEIVDGLKKPGFPTQATFDASVDKTYKAFKIPTYTTVGDAKAGYDQAAELYTNEQDPVRKEAYYRGMNQIGLERINKFYSPAQKAAMKADYTTKLAAVPASDTRTKAYYQFFITNIK